MNYRTMKKLTLIAVLGFLACLAAVRAQTNTAAPAAEAAAAPAAAAAKADPDLAQRVADLEAYVNNGARGADAADAKVKSNVSGSGPGHNGWMMTSSALVLFMTLPGLALFYGGLVRKKNVLSVCAQCLGCAGLVTVLWWAFGYSLVFGKSFGADATILGGTEFFFLKNVVSAPNTDYSY